MADEKTTTRRGAAAAPAATVPEAKPQTAEPVAVDAAAQAAQAHTVEDGDSEGRTKVPREWAIANGEQVLGIPKHKLVAALGEDEREELTINAVRKSVADWEQKVQNPDTTAEEG